jgi:hypothetical protein
VYVVQPKMRRTTRAMYSLIHRLTRGVCRRTVAQQALRSDQVTPHSFTKSRPIDLAISERWKRELCDVL